jgi:hypothetical protein
LELPCSPHAVNANAKSPVVAIRARRFIIILPMLILDFYMKSILILANKMKFKKLLQNDTKRNKDVKTASDH